MARYTSIQNSFASGALSEKMVARTDLALFKQGAAIVENMELTSEGGVTKRFGMEEAGYSSEPDSVWDSSSAESERATYPIEFTTTNGEKYLIIFFRDFGGVKSYVKVFKYKLGAFTQTTFVVNSTMYYGFPTDHMQVGDILFITFDYEAPHCLYFKDGEVRSIAYSSFINTQNNYLGTPVDRSRSDLSVYMHFSISGPNHYLTARDGSDAILSFPYPLFETSTFWPDNRVEGAISLHHVESAADYVFKTSWHSYRNFLSTAPTSFTVGANLKDLVCTDPNLSGVKVSYREVSPDPNAKTGIGYLSLANTLGGSSTYRLYRTWAEAKADNPSNAISFSISTLLYTYLLATSQVQVTTMGAFVPANGTISNVFYESFFGSKNGYPSCVGMVSGRLAFSGVKGHAGRLFLSDYNNLFRINAAKLRQDDQAYYKVNTKAKDVSGLNFFGESVGPDPSVAFVNTGSIENISWIESAGEVSILGSDRGEIAFSASTLDTSIQYTSYTISSYGSLLNNALAVANSVFFVDKNNQLIQITQEGQGVKAGNLSSLNSTILPTNVGSICFSHKKQILYITPLFSDYTIGFTTSRLTGVAGFFKLIFSLEAQEPYTDYIINSLIVDDKLTLIRNRSIIGKEFSIAIEGTDYIDLTDNKFKAKLVTLPIDQGNPYGSSQGIINRLHSIIIKLYKSGHCVFGSNDADLEVAQIEAGIEFTGQLKVNFPASPDTQAVAQIESEENAPLTVLGIVYQGEGYE